MSDLDKSSQKLSQKWVYTIIGLIILIILAYWYSTTIGLLPSLPKVPEVGKNALPVASSTLNDKAAAAGYKIGWVGNPNDTTGRTILAAGYRSKNLLPEQFGWTTEIIKTLNLTSYQVGFGVFRQWIAIPGSKDYYIVLENPLLKSVKDKIFKVRIIIDKTKIPVRVEIAKEIQNIQNTPLNVDNLDYGSKNENIIPSQQYDFFANINKSTLDKIIKPGDVIVVYTVPLDEAQAKLANSTMLIDERDIPFALSISARRFGGIEALKKELK